LNHIEAISKAEEYLVKFLPKNIPLKRSFNEEELISKCQIIIPIIRGLFWETSNGSHWVTVRRSTEISLEFSKSEEALDWTQRGPLTPGSDFV
jgi:rhamnose utilization protein RhaD (predicted bifunctional aldolase and dehydrogenase)